jgi:long-chain acyl-CoA synthetase
MLNLAATLEYSAKTNSDDPAIYFADKVFSYNDVNMMANKVANGLLQSGIKAGDKVALCCPNIPQFIFSYFGILKAGCIVLPFNVLLKNNEIEFILNNSQASGIICFEGTPELAIAKEVMDAMKKSEFCKKMWVIKASENFKINNENIFDFNSLISNSEEYFDTIQCSSENTAVILYTSGTTGKPKGAELTHSNILFNSFIGKDLAQLNKSDKVIMSLPLFHVYGQVVMMLSAILSGSSLIVLPRFDPIEVLQAMEKYKATVFGGVPTMYWALLNSLDDSKVDINIISKNLRVCSAGGSSLPLEVLRNFEEHFKVPILEGYGLSETSPGITFNHLGRERKPGSVGQPVWGIEIKIFDENDKEVKTKDTGEIVVRGHAVMKGYYNNKEGTKNALRGGWFYTGDIGYYDEDGYLYIVDRVKDMIIRGGYNVYPRELEEVLMKHPDISLVAVIGVPHDEWGEEIKACIVLKDGVNCSKEDIIDFAKSNIAAYKYPRIIDFYDSLPLNATGKILKTELRTL